MFAKLSRALNRLPVLSLADEMVCESLRNHSTRTRRSTRQPDNVNRFKILSATDRRGRSGAYFNLGIDVEKNFIMRGRSQEFEKDLDNEDPHLTMNEEADNNEDLNIYARDKDAYHEKVIEEDRMKRRSAKFVIIKKKMEKLDGLKVQHPNLLTWDAKEQIKHLHLNHPGRGQPS